MPHLTPRRTIAAGVATVLLGSGVTAIASQAATNTPAIPSVIPTWAAAAKVLGTTPATQTVWVGLALRGPDDAGKVAFAQAVSTPGNALYRKFLTRKQYNARFAPSTSAATTVAAWLKAAGATNVTVAPGNALIGASMPASIASALFKVGFQELSHAGQTLRVPTAQPTLPANIKALVQAVSGLTEVPIHYDHVVESPSAGATFFNASPCTDTYAGTVVHNESDLTTPGAPYVNAPTQPSSPALTGDQTTAKPYDPCGYTPAQIRGAYGLDKTKYTGKGVTVAIVDAYDASTVVDDTNTYSKLHGLPPVTSTNISPPGLAETPQDPTGLLLDPQGWAGEETLDWEAVHTMAPDASIVYSGAVTPVGPMLNVAVISAMQLSNASEITNSYGGAGDQTGSDKATFDQTVAAPAASMGIGLEYSTGDAADEVGATQTREVDSPADSDMVTGVGGTGLAVGPNNTYGGEYYWGTYKALKSADGTSWGKALYSGAGAGGGVSTSYAEPAWQKGIADAYATNTDTGTTTPGRVLPDVSLVADSTTGFLVGQTQTPDGNDPASGKDTYSEYRIGGTSVSSPLFAGLMADVVQAVREDTKDTSANVGFVNPTMYTFLAKKDGAFHDPSIGRPAGTKRDGGTIKDTLSDASTASDGTVTAMAGSGPGVVPVLADVRSDYTDTADRTTKANATLRTLGNLGTLHDDPAFDDSTGLGSPYAPNFINDFLKVPGPSLPIFNPSIVNVLGAVANPCTIQSSALKISGPKTAKLDKHGLAQFTFTLTIKKGGTCVKPSVAGQLVYLYVDGHRVAKLRTGKKGTIKYRAHLKPGKHTLTATFPGTKVLKKSTSSKYKTTAV